MPSEPTAVPAASSVDFEKVGSEYFQQRELKKGAAGWSCWWAWAWPM